MFAPVAGLVIYGGGYYLVCVWCFMTWKWAFLLFLFSREYWRGYRKLYDDLAEANVGNYGT